jgi:hypothetical protein
MKCPQCDTEMQEPYAMLDMDEQNRERFLRTNLECPKCGMKGSEIDSSEYLELKDEGKGENKNK